MKTEYSQKFNVGIVGFGFLGSAISFGFSNYANIKIYDKYKDSDTLEDVVNHAEIICMFADSILQRCVW
jgi:hypothetical protein